MRRLLQYGTAQDLQDAIDVAAQIEREQPVAIMGRSPLQDVWDFMAQLDRAVWNQAMGRAGKATDGDAQEERGTHEDGQPEPGRPGGDVSR